MRPTIRDGVTALSLANLLLLPTWQVLLVGQKHPYFVSHPPERAYLLGTIAVMLALAVLFWAGWQLANRLGRWGRRLAIGVFLLCLILPLNVIKVQIPWLQGDRLEELLGSGLYMAGVALFLLVAAVVLWRWGRPCVSLCRRAVLVLWPLIALTVGQSVWSTITYKPQVGTHPAPAPRQQSPQTPRRLVWIIFDEFDQRLAFDQRPADLALPELDRWRQEEFVATAAYPPAAMTLLSMPSLTSGQIVTAATPANANDLALTTTGAASPVLWSQTDTVFSRIRKAGGNAAVVGWYHPYSRVLGRDLVSAEWEANDAEQPFTTATSPGQVAWRIIHWSSLHMPLAGRWLRNGPDEYRQVWVDNFQSLRRHSQTALATPDVDLLLLHLPIPHPRAIYNRHTGELLAADDPYPASYFDNLALLDRTLAEIRQQLQKQGDWERTAVLVSADHWWRYKLHRTTLVPEERAFATGEDHRIPFLLHLPGSSPATYDRPFNTIVTDKLLMALWQGQLRHAGDVTAWLDQHRQEPAETPQTKATWPYPGQH